jgi:Methylamine utilisation protein MauE
VPPVSALVSVWLGLVLLAAAASKALRLERGAAALATYGITDHRAQRVGVRLLIACEATLAVCLAVGVSGAAVAAAALFVLFFAVTTLALLAGRGGMSCACLGVDAPLRPTSVARAAALAALAGVVALGWLPRAPHGYERWLTFALSLTVAVVVGLSVALLALAREVGVLRLSANGPRGALELAGEGPALGERHAWARRIAHGPRAHLRLAVFTSDGCPLCTQVAPAVAHVAADPLLGVSAFDEHRDADVWREAAVPGSPYAVAFALDGTALAKGTFNGLGQLESVLASARTRERELSLAA